MPKSAEVFEVKSKYRKEEAWIYWTIFGEVILSFFLCLLCVKICNSKEQAHEVTEEEK